MKYAILYFLLSLFFIQTYAAEKHALVIAIANYEDEKWAQISAIRDISYIKLLLSEQSFDNKNIIFLINEEATKKAVLEQFEILIKKVNEGDVVFVQFCCHGQRVEDISRDENDGFDEALVMYDAYHAPTAKYKGQNHLLDDEIGNFIYKLRKKLGKAGSFNMFIDACYSGSISRYTSTSRGAEVPFMITGNTYNQNQEYTINIDDNFKEYDNSTNNDELSVYAIFSACQNNEDSKEILGDGGESVGALTFSMVKAFRRIQKNDTYRTLFDYINSIISAKSNNTRHPAFEGNIDNVVFNSNIIPVSDYFKVLNKLLNESSTFIVEGGKLTGIYENSVFGFYRAGTTMFTDSDLITEGTVIIANEITSYVRLSSPFSSDDDILNSRLKIIKRGFPKYKLSVGFYMDDTTFIREFKDYFSNSKFIDYSQTENAIQIKYTDDKIIVTDANSLLIEFNKTEPDILLKLYQFLNTYYLKKTLLDFKENTADRSVELNIGPKNLEGNNGYFQIHSGDVIKVEINNRSKKDLYFYLLDFMQEGEVKCHTPKTFEKVIAESRINISLPFKNVNDGFETFKFVFSSEPIIFTEIINDINSKDTRNISGDMSYVINGFCSNESRDIGSILFTQNLTVKLIK